MQETHALPSRQEPEPLLAAVGNRLIRYLAGLDGRFDRLETVELANDVQYACFDVRRAMMYVAISNGGVASRGNAHHLVQLSIDGLGLRCIGASIQLPHRPIHMAVDHARRRLVVAYNRPAAITVHGLDADGRVKDAIGPFEGSDLVGYFPHQVLPVPGSDDLLLTCRGDDATATSNENPGSLRLLRIEQRQAVCKQVIAPGDGYGFGPRNCAFHPTGPWLYAVLERQNALSVFSIVEGTIQPEPTFTLGLLKRPQSIRRPQLAGSIIIHPEGHTAYVVNRWHPGALVDDRSTASQGENSIVVIGIDSLTGEPRALQVVELPGVHARCITMSRCGRLLVAALRQSGVRQVHGREVQCPAGLSPFLIKGCGRLEPLGHQPVDVGGAQLFWAGFQQD